MNNEYRGKNIIYRKYENEVYDSLKASSKFSSNISMIFNIMNPCILPKDSKIEILETNCDYSIQKLDKEININGNKTYNDRSSLEEYIYMKKEYLNLYGKDFSKVILNITEKIYYKIKIVLKIKGIAYSSNCNKIYFEAEAKGEDCISNIFISEICMPNLGTHINDIKLRFINNIKTRVNSNYVFLSPVYDCDMNIEALLGNVFINYELDFETLSLMPPKDNLCKTNKITYKNPKIKICLK